MILSYFRTIALYLILMTVLRLLGKRQIGELEPSEFVVTMLIADLAAIPMQDGAIPLLSGLIPIFTVLGMELVISFLSMKSVKLRRLLCGKPVILIENGKILQDNLRKTGITLDELSGHLREKDVMDLSLVQYAILETSGKLSVFLYQKFQPACAMDAGIAVADQYLPVTLISDGRLMEDNLRLSGRDRAWLSRELDRRGATLAKTWLMTVDQAGNILWYPKEGSE